MDKAQILNDYLDWQRSKRMFPPEFTPEEFLQETLDKDARKKLNLVHEELMKTIEDPMETIVAIQEILLGGDNE